MSSISEEPKTGCCVRTLSDREKLPKFNTDDAQGITRLCSMNGADFHKFNDFGLWSLQLRSYSKSHAALDCFGRVLTGSRLEAVQMNRWMKVLPEVDANIPN
jgi:hypothetical protein